MDGAETLVALLGDVGRDGEDRVEHRLRVTGEHSRPVPRWPRTGPRGCSTAPVSSSNLRQGVIARASALPASTLRRRRKIIPKPTASTAREPKSSRYSA